jgi:glyoxylate reductase
MRPVVVTTRSFAAPAFRRLAEMADVREGLADLRNADGLLCFPGDLVDAQRMESAPRLRAIATCSVGYDHIDIAAAAARGIVCTHTPGVLTDATAELAFALMLACARRIFEGDRLVRSGGFTGFSHDLLVGTELAGATLGVVGAGRIGAAVCERALAFRMRVLYTARTPKPDLEARGARHTTLDELLAESHVVSLHVPLTPETHHLLGPGQLARMRPGSILVNTARGAVVDERALVAALAAGGPPAMAGLDVFEHEPRLAPGLADLPNTVLLPHAGSATRRTRDRMAGLAVEGLLDALAGRIPRHPIPA